MAFSCSCRVQSPDFGVENPIPPHSTSIPFRDAGRETAGHKKSNQRVFVLVCPLRSLWSPWGVGKGDGHPPFPGSGSLEQDYGAVQPDLVLYKCVSDVNCAWWLWEMSPSICQWICNAVHLWKALTKFPNKPSFFPSLCASVAVIKRFVFFPQWVQWCWGVPQSACGVVYLSRKEFKWKWATEMCATCLKQTWSRPFPCKWHLLLHF